MGEKTDRRVRMTKRMLRDSLISLMSEKPISRITVKELCEAADINRGTFYAHFGSPYDLLRQIETEVADDVQQQMNTLGYGIRPTDPTRVVTAVLAYVRENERTFRVLLGDEAGGRLPALVLDAVERRFVPQSDTVPGRLTRYRYTFITLGVLGLLRRYLQNDMADLPIDDMARLIVTQIEHGLYA